MWLTALAIVNKPAALQGVVAQLERLGADPVLIEVCRRRTPLRPAPPPGSDEIETGARTMVKAS